MSFLKVFDRARRRGLLALSVLAILASVATATSALARDDEITITISQIIALDPADVWLAGPDDFYARVTIAGQSFVTPIKRQQNKASPNWKISKVVPRGKTKVRLEIFDKDIGKADDKIDINRVTSPKRDLDFTVDTRRCRVLEFSEPFRCGDVIRRAGNEPKKAEVSFSVDVNR